MSLPQIQDILKMLPHRYPFLLVDRVVEVVKSDGPNGAGSRIKAIKNVTFNEPFFTGHFPDNPIMPGVLIIEALAQTAALLAYKPHPENKQFWTFLIAGVDKARFRRPVVPGDQLTLVSTCLKDRGSIVVFKCEAYVGEELATEAEIMAKMV